MRAGIKNTNRSTYYMMIPSRYRYIYRIPRIVLYHGLEFRVLSALRDPFLDAGRTLSFASSATVPACLDLTWGGPTRWPARGPVRPA